MYTFFFFLKAEFLMGIPRLCSIILEFKEKAKLDKIIKLNFPPDLNLNTNGY